MRRASTFAAILAATGGLVLADSAYAQSDPRYLSWQGRGDAAPPQSYAPAEPPAAGGGLRRPNRVIPHGGFPVSGPIQHGLTPAPGPARPSLTPANAWLQPHAPAPAPIPEPIPQPPPRSTPVLAPPAPPPASPPPRPAPPPAGPEYLLDQSGQGQPAPAELIYPQSTPAAEFSTEPADPMAPRRDAPVFRMQQTSPPRSAEARTAPPEENAATSSQVDATVQPRRVVEATNSGERPPQQGARYYSVHRQNGREPDPLVMPESSYVDALVVSMAETPASQDLAAPEQGPTLIRDRNGNMRAAPAPSDGDHQ